VGGGPQPFPVGGGPQPFPVGGGPQPFPGIGGSQPFPGIGGSQPFPGIGGSQPFPGIGGGPDQFLIGSGFGPDPFFSDFGFGPDPFAFDPFFQGPEPEFFIREENNLFFVDPTTPNSESNSAATSNASDVFLLGDFLQLGIADAGSLGSQGSAPAGTITSGPNTGLSVMVDTDGFASGSSTSPPRSGDFFLPASDAEGFVLGFKTNSGSPGQTTENFLQDRNSNRNDINAGTVDSSVGTTHSTTTNATFTGSNASAAVSFVQVISFDDQDSFFKTEISITNSGTVTLEDFRYMRTMNPNQDADTSGQFNTNNDVVSQPSGSVSTAIAQATGPNSGISINLISTTDSLVRASNFGTNNSNVFDSQAFSSPVDRAGNPVDEAIVLTIKFGDIAAGATVTKSFFTAFQDDNSFNSAANDMLVGTDTGETINAGDGNDTIFDLGGVDVINGGSGNDTFIAGSGNDTFNGGSGTDTIDYRDSAAINASFASSSVSISGTAEVDSFSNIEGISGSALADTITGASAAETITGAGGKDTLTGNGGADIFAYLAQSDGEIRSANGSLGSHTGDVIADFASGTDKISLTKTGFSLSSVSNGANFEVISAAFNGTNASSTEFAAGRAALIYSQTDDVLYFDDDGASAGYTILLETTTNLAATDIVIV
jgi:Ca2+-binding RTX toxin-like protein